MLGDRPSSLTVEDAPSQRQVDGHDQLIDVDLSVLVGVQARASGQGLLAECDIDPADELVDRDHAIR